MIVVIAVVVMQRQCKMMSNKETMILDLGPSVNSREKQHRPNMANRVRYASAGCMVLAAVYWTDPFALRPLMVLKGCFCCFF